MIEPKAAVRNFARLSKAGARGRYGFREALDYTARRLPEGASVAIVQSYMAHHQGMALVALGNVLNDRAMVERFHADPIVEATELLLQERMPRDVLVARPRAEEVKSAADVRDLVPPILRRFTSPHDAIPRTHLLSNGRYAVMVTAAGSGLQPLARHRGDPLARGRDPRLRGAATSSSATCTPARCGRRVTSRAAPRPTATRSTSPRTTPSSRRRDGSIATDLTIVVSAEHDAEIRRVSLTNLGSHDREIELTSYAEIVLAPQAADVAHPAFQNLFVQTEFVPEHRRAPGDPPSAIRRRAADLGRARRGRRGADRRRHPVRDGPRPLPRPGPVGPLAGLGHRRPPALEHGRRGARSDLQPPAPGHARPRRDRPRDLLHGRRRVTRGGPRPRRQVPRSRPRSSGPRSWPGRRPRSSSITSASSRTRPTSSSASPTGSSTRTRRCGRRRACWPATSGAHRACGPTASPATCPSSWSGSTKPRTSTSSASCCAPTSTGG